MLHVRCDQLVLWWKTLHLLVTYRSEQGALATVIRTAEAITSASLQVQARVVKQCEGPVTQREDAVAQILAFLIGIIHVVLLCKIIAALQQDGHELFGILLAENVRSQIRRDARPPLGVIEHATGTQGDTELCHIVHHDLQQGLDRLVWCLGKDHFNHRVFVNLLLPISPVCLLQGLVAAICHAAHFGIGYFLGSLCNERDQGS
mmetsp:Transcript_124620/g.219415  ORF Transcript_124620/g.219415 Transcript_124620/m.219415 type:complete len:204 (+) Transcript_124620:567-1178(+)